MATAKSKKRSKAKSAPEPEDFLTTAAKTVGHAAGKAAKAMGLSRPNPSADSGVEPTPTRAKPAKRPSARARRKTKAEEVKSAAENLLSKSQAELGAPYRRIMGKPAANWSDKDIEYVNGLVARQSA